MAVKIQVSVQVPHLVYKINHIGEGLDGRSLVVRPFVVRIQIVPVSVQSCVSVVYSVWVQHGDNQEHSILQEIVLFGFFEQSVDNPLQHVARGHFRRVDSRTNHDVLFVREEESVALFFLWECDVVGRESHQTFGIKVGPIRD